MIPPLVKGKNKLETKKDRGSQPRAFWSAAEYQALGERKTGWTPWRKTGFRNIFVYVKDTIFMANYSFLLGYHYITIWFQYSFQTKIPLFASTHAFLLPWEMLKKETHSHVLKQHSDLDNPVWNLLRDYLSWKGQSMCYALCLTEEVQDRKTSPMKPLGGILHKV